VSVQLGGFAGSRDSLAGSFLVQFKDKFSDPSWPGTRPGISVMKFTAFCDPSSEQLFFLSCSNPLE
jgi:hypothetical protein